MDIYARKSYWKWYLAIAGLVIVLITMYATNYLVGELKARETNRVELFANTLEEELKKGQEITEAELPDDYFTEDATAYLKNIQLLLEGVPVIILDESGFIYNGYNFGGAEADIEFLKKELEKIKATGAQPIKGQGYISEIYYKNTTLLTYLQYFPILQFLLISSFITFGYFMFSSARRAEQNQVWVGMSKETAHQLGTPISAIMGWIDHLRDTYPKDEYMQDVVGELEKDVNRLDLVADRFSKIGSTPELVSINIYEELENMRAYMKRRASRKISFKFPDPEASPKLVQINPPLFNWVLENLLRNALDAMGGEGTISATVYEEKDFVCIDVSDTGKGIPSSKFKTVFKPGYSTKKRGWGLGLSLAKRIIETYHSGRIFVAESLPKEKTTFTIKLPKKIISSAKISPS